MLDSQYIQTFGDLNFIKDPTFGYLLLANEEKTTSLPSYGDNFTLYELADGSLIYSSSFMYYGVQPEIINPQPTPAKVAAPKEIK